MVVWKCKVYYIWGYWLLIKLVPSSLVGMRDTATPQAYDELFSSTLIGFHTLITHIGDEHHQHCKSFSKAVISYVLPLCTREERFQVQTAVHHGFNEVLFYFTWGGHS